VVLFGSPLSPKLGDKIAVCAVGVLPTALPYLQYSWIMVKCLLMKKSISPPVLFPTFWRNFLFSLSNYHPLTKRNIAKISFMKKNISYFRFQKQALFHEIFPFYVEGICSEDSDGPVYFLLYE
jgi:hypothetical protein